MNDLLEAGEAMAVLEKREQHDVQTVLSAGATLILIAEQHCLCGELDDRGWISHYDSIDELGEVVLDTLDYLFDDYECELMSEREFARVPLLCATNVPRLARARRARPRARRSRRARARSPGRSTDDDPLPLAERRRLVAAAASTSVGSYASLAVDDEELFGRIAGWLFALAEDVWRPRRRVPSGASGVGLNELIACHLLGTLDAMSCPVARSVCIAGHDIAGPLRRSLVCSRGRRDR